MGGIKSCRTQPGKMAAGMNGSRPSPLLGPVWCWDLSAQATQSPGLAWEVTPTGTSERGSSAQRVLLVLPFKKMT